MTKVALIFGVTGQDGSILSDLLLSKGYLVVGVGRRTSTPNDTRIRHLYSNSNFRFLNGDVTDAFSVSRLLKEVNPDEVYNLAAQSHVGVSFDEPGHTWDVTAKGCLNILEAIRELDTRHTTRFYQASSSEMFGSACSVLRPYYPGPLVRTDYLVSVAHSHTFQDEFTPMMPKSPYAIAKLAAHNLVRLYRDAYGIHASSGILFNHESERRGEAFVTRKITKHVAKLAAQKKNGGAAVEKLHLGNLEASRDWGHAEDYVRAMWLMLQQKVADDYVVATGDTYTVREFLHAAFLLVGIDLSFEDSFARHIAFNKNLFRPSEVPYLRGCASKARAVLGWVPNINFNDLVKRMVLSDMVEAGV